MSDESICHECVYRLSKSPTQARCKRYPSFSVDAVDQCAGFRSLDSLKPNQRQVGGDHYTRHAIQPWDIIREYGLDFFEGNVIKYVLRHKGDRAEDLKKARHYLDYLIEREGGS